MVTRPRLHHLTATLRQPYPPMYLVLIAWFYITLLMALAEATSPTGTVLGALVTFALYGLLPMGIMAYILGTPARKRALRAQALAEQASEQAPADAPASAEPDAGSHAPAAAQGSAVAPVRKEP